jgi:hypothetical protein
MPSRSLGRAGLGLAKDGRCVVSRRLEIFLRGSAVEDVKLDGESVWPTWLKVEFKETGALSAKVKGERLSTNFGDEIELVHLGEPDAAMASGGRVQLDRE